MIPRHVPPTASPLSARDWLHGLTPTATASADFDAALAAYLGVPFVFTAASGRTALRLLLDTLRLRPELADRREVALPGFTCPSVAKVILDAGLTPHPVEMDPATLNMLPDALADAVGSRTLAVMPVHPFGLPVDVAPAARLAQDVGAILIEDVAQSMGARQAGRRVGTAHDVGLFSLGPGKPLSLGGGGLLATCDARLGRELAATWANLPPMRSGRSVWAWARLGLFSLAFMPPLWYWATRAGAQQVGEQESSWGYAHRGLAASQAAVGMAALARLDAVNAARRTRAAALTDGLTDVAGLIQPRPRGVDPEPIYLRLPLLLPDAASADELTRRAAAAGLGVGRMYRRTLAEFFLRLGLPLLPGAQRIAATLVTLPTNHHLQAGDLNRLVMLVRSL